MGKLSSIFFCVSIVAMFSPILSRSSHHEHNQDKNWIGFLPAVFQLNMTSFTDDSTEGISGASESSTPTILGSDTYNQGSSKSVVVGVPIGGIILFILICYCCYRCFCRPKVVVQGATIIRPPPQPQGPAPIIIQNVTSSHAPQNSTNYEMGHPPQPMPQWNQHVPPPPHQYYPEGPGYNPNAPPQYGRY